MYRVVIAIVLTLNCSSLFSQRDSINIPSERFLLKVYPLRFVYGLHMEMTCSQRNYQEISFMLQHHQRDWFVIGDHLDPIGFSYIPSLEEADGYTAYLSYQFPLSEPPVNVWWGPKIGIKDVNTMVEEFDFQGNQEFTTVDQTNYYFLLQGTLRNKRKGFVFETYLHLGAVNVLWQETDLDAQGNVIFDRDQENFWAPHILGGISLGWGF